MVIGAGSAFEVSNKGTLKRLPDVTVEKGSTFIIGNIINKDTREPLRDLPLFLCRIIDSGKDKKQGLQAFMWVRCPRLLRDRGTIRLCGRVSRS
jgi:hypothetical protein